MLSDIEYKQLSSNSSSTIGSNTIVNNNNINDNSINQNETTTTEKRRLNKFFIQKTPKEQLVTTNHVYVSTSTFTYFLSQINLTKEETNSCYLLLLNPNLIINDNNTNNNNGKDIKYLNETMINKFTTIYRCEPTRKVIKNLTQSTICLNLFQRKSLHLREGEKLNGLVLKINEDILGGRMEFQLFNKINYIFKAKNITFIVKNEQDVVNIMKLKIDKEIIIKNLLKILNKQILRKNQFIGIELGIHKKLMIELLVKDFTKFDEDNNLQQQFTYLDNDTKIEIQFSNLSESFFTTDVILEEQPCIKLQCSNLLIDNDAYYNTAFCSNDYFESEQLIDKFGNIKYLYCKVLPHSMLYKVKLKPLQERQLILFGKFQRLNLQIKTGDLLLTQFLYLNPNELKEISNEEFNDQRKENNFFSKQALKLNENNFRSLQAITFKINFLNQHFGSSINLNYLISNIYNYCLNYYLNIGQDLILYINGNITVHLKVIAVNGVRFLSKAPIGGFLTKHTTLYFEKDRSFEYCSFPSSLLLELKESCFCFFNPNTNEKGHYFVNASCPVEYAPQCVQIINSNTLNILNTNNIPRSELKTIQKLNTILRNDLIIRVMNDKMIIDKDHYIFDLINQKFYTFNIYGVLINEIQSRSNYNELEENEIKKEWPKLYNDFTICKNFNSLTSGCSANIYKNNFIIIFGGISNENTPNNNLFIYSIKDNLLVQVINKDLSEIETFFIPQPRCHHSSNIYNNDELIIFGGLTFNPQQKQYNSLNEIHSLNLKTLEFRIIFTKNTVGSEIPTRFYHHSLLVDDSLFIVAGCHSSTTVAEFCDIWEFNLFTKYWRKLTILQNELYLSNIYKFERDELYFIQCMKEIQPTKSRLSVLQRQSKDLKIVRYRVHVHKSPLKTFFKLQELITQITTASSIPTTTQQAAPFCDTVIICKKL
ncbi:hypothetical protein ABK040_011661 [Willaertia magna]